MNAQNIEKKVKFIRDTEGDLVEVILPYGIYQELITTVLKNPGIFGSTLVK